MSTIETSIFYLIAIFVAVGILAMSHYIDWQRERIKQLEEEGGWIMLDSETPKEGSFIEFLTNKNVIVTGYCRLVKQTREHGYCDDFIELFSMKGDLLEWEELKAWRFSETPF